MKARWTGKPDPYVGLEVGTLGTVRLRTVSFAGVSYSAVFTWAVPGFVESEEVYCNPEDYEEA